MRTTTIKIIDNRRNEKNHTMVSAGVYNGKIIHFGLINEVNDDDESTETLLIKYGDLKKFEWCSCYTTDPSFVYLSSAINGKFGDIKMEMDMWVKILGRLDSKIILNQWLEKLHSKQVA